MPAAGSGRTAQDWVQAALKVLVRKGVAAVAVEPLARSLGVTKGSFYWHFKDRAALLAQVLKHWEAVATQQVMDAVEAQGGSAADRLGALMVRTSQHPEAPGLEAALRAWGALDVRVRKVLERVDARREDYVTGLLVEHGLRPGQARRRSRILYLALIGEFAWVSHGGAPSGAGPFEELVALALQRAPRRR